jgi:hypothetical protein
MEESEDNEIVQKLGTILINNGWNDKNEKIIIYIGENAVSYKWMHEKSAYHYQFLNNTLTIILIIFSSLLTAETIITNESIVVEIIRRVITYIITVLSVINNFLNYEKLSEKHLASSIQFSVLYHDIQQQMCMYRQDRQNAIKYVSSILKKYDSLVLSCPTIATKILKQFKETFKNSDISLPAIADNIQKIEIISENNTELKSDIERQPVNVNLSNLNDIYNVFKVTGDISDNDLKNINKQTIKEYINEYEKIRWKAHSELD